MLNRWLYVLFFLILGFGFSTTLQAQEACSNYQIQSPAGPDSEGLPAQPKKDWDSDSEACLKWSGEKKSESSIRLVCSSDSDNSRAGELTQQSTQAVKESQQLTRSGQVGNSQEICKKINELASAGEKLACELRKDCEKAAEICDNICESALKKFKEKFSSEEKAPAQELEKKHKVEKAKNLCEQVSSKRNSELAALESKNRQARVRSSTCGSEVTSGSGGSGRGSQETPEAARARQNPDASTASPSSSPGSGSTNSNSEDKKEGQQSQGSGGQGGGGGQQPQQSGNQDKKEKKKKSLQIQPPTGPSRACDKPDSIECQRLIANCQRDEFRNKPECSERQLLTTEPRSMSPSMPTGQGRTATDPAAPQNILQDRGSLSDSGNWIPPSLPKKKKTP